jgi:Spy/CpxP family protein refolding chaperone
VKIEINKNNTKGKFMLKSILASAMIVALMFGISYSSIASELRPVTLNSGETHINPNVSVTAFENADNPRNRIDMQVQRYVRDYNLTEQQQAEVHKILTDFEARSNELRTKLNSLNLEKKEKIESLLTDEQKKMKEDSQRDRRSRLIERRNEERNRQEAP